MSKHNIPFSEKKKKKKKKITLNYPESAAMGFFEERVGNSRGYEPSVFEPLKFYCINFYLSHFAEHFFYFPALVSVLLKILSSVAYTDFFSFVFVNLIKIMALHGICRTMRLIRHVFGYKTAVYPP